MLVTHSVSSAAKLLLPKNCLTEALSFYLLIKMQSKTEYRHQGNCNWVLGS